MSIVLIEFKNYNESCMFASAGTAIKIESNFQSEDIFLTKKTKQKK